MAYLLEELNISMHIPEDYLCKIGEKNEYFYVIAKGECAVIIRNMMLLTD